MSKPIEASIVVVDDEPSIRELLVASLHFAGFDVATAASGSEAIEVIEKTQPDLIVLDVMLPDIDGFTVTRRIRQEGIGAPVLFLTARDDTQDKVMGLTVGGDDYVTKPFSLEEVVARIRAILRRTREQVEDDPIIRVGDLEINEDSHDVSRAGHAIDLSPTEYKLLRYLMDNEGRVLSKAQILDHVWQYDWGGDAAIVESYISYLRKKVDGIMVTDDNGEQHKVTPLIETKRGIGYMIREPESRREAGAMTAQTPPLTGDGTAAGPAPAPEPSPTGTAGPGNRADTSADSRPCEPEACDPYQGCVGDTEIDVRRAPGRRSAGHQDRGVHGHPADRGYGRYITDVAPAGRQLHAGEDGHAAVPSGATGPQQHRYHASAE